MSEKILKALMQLFAIIAKVDGVTSDGRKVVQLFLKQQLNQDLVDEYLKLFDHFLEEQPERKKTADGTRKRTSVKDSVRVLFICTQINAELTQKQKIVVLIRILEFINAGKILSEQEIEFATTVASTFNISDEEFNNIRNFVLHPENEPFSCPDLLIINNSQKGSVFTKKHIYSENISGHMEVLRIHSVDMYVVRYIGESELYLNGQGIRKNQVYLLTNGCSIRSSKVSPVYYSDIVGCFLSDTAKTKIHFTVDNVEYEFKNGKKGLYELNYGEESGKMIGIMGASGAGKSTLLNILNGIEKPTKGRVLINGIDIHNQKKSIEGVIGYVSQDDLLIEELSVFENLFYNAKLCFGGYTDQEITKLVLKLLEDLGLFEIRSLKVGSPLNKKISGGQRKRLNIGLELIREPSVLFVDEPTSGLSSRDSENIMDLLKELSLKGKLVFVVIHQPSSDIFKMFDKLLILDSGGFPIYIGNPVDAILYFKKIINHVNADESECITCGNVNPEQIFNIIESKVIDEYGNPTRERKISPRQWNEYYLKHIEGKNIPHEGKSKDVPKSSFSIPGKIKQFGVFTIRDVLSKLSNTQYMLINFLEAPLLAFILAYLVRYYNINSGENAEYIFRENANIPAYLFMSIVVALFMGLTVSAEEIIKDRKILKREAFLNLSWASYLYSKISILFIISAIQTLTYVLLGNWLLGIKGMTVSYWLVLFTTSCFANMLGLNISASFNSAVTIYILIPILLIPQLLLSGVIVKFDKLNPSIASDKYVPVTGEMMTSRWAFEALAVNQFMNNEYEKIFYKYDRMMSISNYKKQLWVQELRARLDYCVDNIQGREDHKQYASKLALIQTEIKKEMDVVKSAKLDAVDSLTPALFNFSVAQKVRNYLNSVSDIYVKLFNKSNAEEDKIITSMQSTPEEKERFLALRNKYENESLSDLVKNSKEFVRIVEHDGELVQKVDPVFLEPEYSNIFDFRAHFFAPKKQFMNRYFDTFWVNITLLWAMSLFLYVALYFEWLRKFLNYFEVIAGRFSKKQNA